MKLSLSVRIAENYSDKKKSVLSLKEICENAKLSNYQGICMRPSQVGIENSKEEILEAYQIVTSNNLTVSMITGDFDIPANNELAGIAQRNITPYIDLCKLLNSNLIRIAIKKRVLLINVESESEVNLINRISKKISRKIFGKKHVTLCLSRLLVIGGRGVVTSIGNDR